MDAKTGNMLNYRQLMNLQDYRGEWSLSSATKPTYQSPLPTIPAPMDTTSAKRTAAKPAFPSFAAPPNKSALPMAT